MKISPIPFSTEMVRAIKSGTKSQTRRLKGLEQINAHPDDWGLTCVGRLNSKGHQHHGKFGATFYRAGFNYFMACPYGGPGDLLYVRETIRKIPRHDGTPVYREDIPDDVAPAFVWRPSIHMPRTQSRITIELHNLRVERIQEISITDVIREGAQVSHVPLTKKGKWTDDFQALWDSLNAARGYGWDMNPWVWALDFPDKVYQQNIDRFIAENAARFTAA